MTSTLRRWAARAAALLGVAAATWLALALILYLLLYRTIGDVYQNIARSVLQIECGRMIEGPLLYTLAPGECRFANPEFDTRIIVDADGFRNAAAHLGAGPIKVAVLGDSHAMGWGVAQHEKVASLLARDPRFSVRDLAMSSFGTAREMLALSRYAATADVVVLQYCDNDKPENEAFLASPAAFAASAPQRAAAYWADLARLREISARGSTARDLLRFALAALASTWRAMGLPPRGSRETPLTTLAEEARLFAGVLSHFKQELAGKTIVVYDSFPRAARTGFAPAFRRALSSAGFEDIVVLELTDAIGPRDYYHIDDHMRAGGHAKVASRILAELDKPGRLPRP